MSYVSVCVTVCYFACVSLCVCAFACARVCVYTASVRGVGVTCLQSQLKAVKVREFRLECTFFHSCASKFRCSARRYR